MRALTQRLLVCALLATSSPASAAVPAGRGADQSRQQGRTLIVGDSLSLGAAPFLRRQRGVGRLRFDHEVGRASAQGLRRWRRLVRASHTRAVFALGTNDDPAQPQPLLERVERARRFLHGSDRCMVIASLVRPPAAATAQVNRRLRRWAARHPRVRLVEWARHVRQHPQHLAPDKVHATPAGYRARAALLARALRSC